MSSFATETFIPAKDGNSSGTYRIISTLKAKVTLYRAALAGSILIIATIITLAATGVFTPNKPASNTGLEKTATISVLHAGSLVNLMSLTFAPYFTAQTHVEVNLVAKGSVALANDIKNNTPADVFISADAAPIKKSLMGAQNNDLVSWYVSLGRTGLGLAYSASGPYTALFESVARGTTPWYEALARPGIKIGRTDPDLDPKGYRTVMLMALAETFYNQSNLSMSILAGDSNRQQIFTEENLEKYVSAGDLDVGFFYEIEATSVNNARFIRLPTEIDMSDPALNAVYAKASYTNSKTQQIYNGSATEYVVTIPKTSMYGAEAEKFVAALLSEQGQALLQSKGMRKTPLVAAGDTSAMPQAIKELTVTQP